MRTRIGILPLLLLCAACERGSSEPPPEVQAARLEAKQRACIGAELAREAEDRVQTLETTLNLPGATPSAVLIFSRAYQQHALLRQAVYAQNDSSLNHSPTPEDSARHAGQASRFEIIRPEPGSVEANVIQDYERKFVAILGDVDHPCNWNLEEEEGGNP